MLGIGDQCVDRLVHKKVQYPGGNALNVAVHAHRMGARAAFLGVFGDDAPASFVRGAIEREGVEISHCRYARGENAHFDIRLDDGDRTIYNLNDGALEREPLRFSRLDDAYIRGFDWMHSGCYCHIESELLHLKSLGVPLSYDFSNDRDEDYILQYAPYIDVACYSSDLPDEDLKPQMERVAAAGAPMVLVTRGTDGALLLDESIFYAQSACRVRAIDTTGAGDSFIAAFLTAYFAGLSRLRDFPGQPSPGQPSPGNRPQRGNLLKIALYRGAVYAADSCLSAGSFGQGAPWDGK